MRLHQLATLVAAVGLAVGCATVADQSDLSQSRAASSLVESVRSPGSAGSASDRSAPAVVEISSALLDPSQTNLTLRFLAGGGNPCVGTGDRWFTGTVKLSPSTAAISMTEHYAGPPAEVPGGAECAWPLNGRPEKLTVTLTEPLGDRAIVGPGGRTIPVVRA